MNHEVQFSINTDCLSGHTDSHLAALWHISQANPAPLGDKSAGKLADAIGFEIIKRFLKFTAPDRFAHCGVHHYWAAALEARSAMIAAEGHWVTVPARTLPNGRKVESFIFAKYPCAQGKDGKILLSPSAKPWVNIDHHQAVAACVASGHYLSSETQELAIRLDVCEQDINWTGGKVGQGKVFQGLHKGTVSSAQAADYVSTDADERSWHQLSTGERVYGLAGNIYTHVFDDIQGDGRGVVARAFASDSPSLTAAPYPSREKGMGWRPADGSNWSGSALLRGGYWDDGGYAGVFRLGYDSPGYRSDSVGFRCTKPSSGL